MHLLWCLSGLMAAAAEPHNTHPANYSAACCAGWRFGLAFCVVIALAVYQLCTSGLLGIQEGLPDGLRGGLLGGLAGLLLPLLFLCPGSGAVFVKDTQKAASVEEANLLPGECMLPAAVCMLSALAGVLHSYLCNANAQ